MNQRATLEMKIYIGFCPFLDDCRVKYIIGLTVILLEPCGEKYVRAFDDAIQTSLVIIGRVVQVNMGSSTVEQSAWNVPISTVMVNLLHLMHKVRIHIGQFYWHLP